MSAERVVPKKIAISGSSGKWLSGVFKRLEGGNSGLGPTLRSITVHRPAQNTDTGSSSIYDPFRVDRSAHVSQRYTDATHHWGTEAKNGHVTFTKDSSLQDSFKVGPGTHADTNVMEGVCDCVEVRTHDVSGSHVDDRDMDRVSMEAVATQDMGGRQDALDKEQTSPASVVSKPHVVGVPVNEGMSPQIRQFSWGETVGKSMLVPMTVGKHRVFCGGWHSSSGLIDQ